MEAASTFCQRSGDPWKIDRFGQGPYAFSVSDTLWVLTRGPYSEGFTVDPLVCFNALALCKAPPKCILLTVGLD